MLLPTTSIDGFDAILNTIDAQLTGTHPDHGAMLEMSGIRNGIVSFHVALIRDPQVSKDRYGPVSRGNVAKGMEEQRVQDKFVAR